VVIDEAKPGEQVVVEGLHSSKGNYRYTQACASCGGRKLSYSKFFINRPIVAIGSPPMVDVGAVTIATLPVAQFPNTSTGNSVTGHVPGRRRKYPRAGRATPIEQQING